MAHEAFERVAQADPESDAAWASIDCLRHMPVEVVGPLALGWLKDAEPRRRTIAVDVLAQCVPLNDQGLREGAAADAVRDALVEMSEAEADPRVIEALAVASSFLPGSVWLSRLAGWAHSGDPGVREAVAVGLGSQELSREVENLTLMLSADPEPNVRNWAAFAMKQWCEYEDQEAVSSGVRDRLVDLLSDPDPDVFAEAVAGLVYAGHPQGPELLEGALRELGSSHEGSGYSALSAAREYVLRVSGPPDE